ncbi:MAG: N-acetyltransferase family protein [Rhodospirillales bacterium]
MTNAVPTNEPEIIVREASDGDMAAVQVIYAHHVLNGFASFEETPPDVEEMARRRADLTGHGLPFRVACLDGVVKGYAYAVPYRRRSAYRYTVEDSVYIAPDCLGLGLGARLLEDIIETCAALGYRQMVAIIGGSDNSASINLHAKHGFVHAGMLKSAGFKFGRWADSVIMQRPLGSGNETLPG